MSLLKSLINRGSNLHPPLSLIVVALSFSGCKYTHSSGSSGGAATTCEAQFAPASLSSATPLGLNESSTAVGSVAQSFQVAQTIKVSVVRLGLLAIVPKNETIQGNLTLTLESDNGGVPSGIVLGSATIAANSISSTLAQNYDFNFPSSVNLAQTDPYWLVLSAGYGANSTNYIEWLGASNNERSGGFQVLTTSLVESQQVWIQTTQSAGSDFEMAFGVGCP